VRLIAVGLVGALALAGAFVVLTLQPVADRGAAQVTIIPPGASLREIAGQLRAAGLIRSPLAFIVAARLRGWSGALRHGEYALSPAMSTLEILERLARGDVILHRVTIPEGYTIAQIAATLAAQGLADQEAFLQLARQEGLTFRLPGLPLRSNLEGYLFPDTYFFPRGLPPRQIVETMLRRFAERVPAALRAEAARVGLSLHTVVTVASMVERETRMPAERPVIAGVIYNRLRRGWRLEIDATVLYALGRHAERVTAADLQVDSPYNTYRHAGLPPGPISNPGLAAIVAAVRPAAVPYLFYVLRPDGSHEFSRTLEEHQRAVRRWRP